MNVFFYKNHNLNSFDTDEHNLMSIQTTTALIPIPSSIYRRFHHSLNAQAHQWRLGTRVTRGIWTKALVLYCFILCHQKVQMVWCCS